MIWIKRIALIFLTIFLGTIIDYIVHNMSVHFYVAFNYYPHKILYGTLWACLGYLAFHVFFRKHIKTPFALAVTLAAVPAVLLQTWYFYLNHQPKWIVLVFLVLHFFMFLLPGYYIHKKYKNLFFDTPN